jgi:hypothetical protein
MPAERLSMRKVREVLRLKHTLGMSFRQISEATGVGKTVVGEYVRRAGVIGITWPVPEAIDPLATIQASTRGGSAPPRLRIATNLPSQMLLQKETFIVSPSFSTFAWTLSGRAADALVAQADAVGRRF